MTITGSSIPAVISLKELLKYDSKSGRAMEVFTTKPGIQFIRAT